MLKHLIANVNTRTQTLWSITQRYLYDSTGAAWCLSNQLTASLHSETPSVEQGKLLAPPWHCFSAALSNPHHRFALTASLIT